MIGRPGSTLWLMANEARLGWRGLVGGPRARRRIITLAVLGAVFGLMGVPVALALRRVEVPVNAPSW